MKILFVYQHSYPHLWKDGLYAALELLERNHDITWINLATTPDLKLLDGQYDIALGWGAFGSDVDTILRTLNNQPIALCIAGNAIAPYDVHDYEVLFHETYWYEPIIEEHPNKYHAFGVNTDIFRPLASYPQWDVISVGAYALWKRQLDVAKKDGKKLLIGEIQSGNLEESLSIMYHLSLHGCYLSGMRSPEELAELYNQSKLCYIPADINGGGERAVLEARACGIGVEVNNDNPKLKELMYSPIYDHIYYSEQLERGLKSCL